MVRFRSVMQDADRFRDPLAYDPAEALSLTCSMGDPRTAKRALFAWLEDWMDALQARHAPLKDARKLRAQYLAHLGKIDGRLAVMSTEIGHFSQNVAPDFGKVTYNYAEWASPGFLQNLFGAGKEVVIEGHVGTGKTHLAVQFMDGALRLADPGFTVITNVSGVEDPEGRFPGRIHGVSLLSEVLRIWAHLPLGARILLVLDEPESTLQGGMSRSVLDFKVFRFMIRKLGMAKIEIWHNTSDQYKGLREDKSEQVYRIKKEQKDAFTFTQRRGEQVIKQRVENVPRECGLGFATEGMATIGVDVNISALVMRIGKLWRPADIKAEVRRALEDPAIYHVGFRSKEAEEKAEAEKQERDKRRDEARVGAILADEARFLARRGDGFDRNAIQKHFNTTERDADYLALRAWQARPPVDPIEQAIRTVLERSDEFLGKQRRSFDRQKIMRGLGLSDKDARIVAKQAWERRRA
jgi:hypothetical protein